MAGIGKDSILQAVTTAISMWNNGDVGLDVPNYVEDVSEKVVKIIQSYSSIIPKVVYGVKKN